MLKINEINKVFQKYPLCSGHLIQHRGMATEYCAMGALAKACGITDAQLEAYNPGGEELFNGIRPILLEKFGIETYTQFSNLMVANDASKNSVTRNREVEAKVIEMTANDVVNLFREAEAEHQPTPRSR